MKFDISRYMFVADVRLISNNNNIGSTQGATFFAYLELSSGHLTLIIIMNKASLSMLCFSMFWHVIYFVYLCTISICVCLYWKLLQLLRNFKIKKNYIHIKKGRKKGEKVSNCSWHVGLPPAALLSCAELCLDSDWGWPDGAEKQIYVIWPWGSRERKWESLLLHIYKKSPVFFPCPAVQCDMRWPATGFGSERNIILRQDAE